MSAFTDGLKKGAGRALGGALAIGALGLIVASPAGAVAGFKAGVGIGAMCGGS